MVLSFVSSFSCSFLLVPIYPSGLPFSASRSFSFCFSSVPFRSLSPSVLALAFPPLLLVFVHRLFIPFGERKKKKGQVPMKSRSSCQCTNNSRQTLRHRWLFLINRHAANKSLASFPRNWAKKVAVTSKFTRKPLLRLFCKPPGANRQA